MAAETRDGLSAREARRMALAAQGLAKPRPSTAIEKAHVRRTVEKLGLLQIDSVNVFARAHTMPLFSRLGAYETGHIADLGYGGKRRAFFEYWAHEASYLPVALHPLLRWRMARAERGEGIYKGLVTFAVEKRDFVRGVLADIERRGPLAASEVEGGGRAEGSWWGWSDAKHAVEYLFWAGKLTTATRRGAFERVYDVPERVFSRAVLDAPTPPEAEAQRELLRLSAQALGVATERDLRDYYRLDVTDTKLRLAELVEEGALQPVRVEGWTDLAYLAPDAALPRKGQAVALLSPFDPLVFERARTERIFGFRYRIEIYTPAEKREFGYYCLPFLMGERIVARVDLKADRAAGVLRVLSAHHEAGVDVQAVAEALAGELRLAALWSRLGDVAVSPKGDLAGALALALG